MNKKIIASMIKKPPSIPEKGYVFVNDNKSICDAVIVAEHLSLYIAPADSEHFFDAESFREYIRNKSDMGTYLTEYTFVLSCFRKKTNDDLEKTLKSNMIPYRQGAYTLFKDKEYLSKYEFQEDMKKTLDAYVKRFEGDDVGPVDRRQFCRIDANGNPKGVHDLRVVEYLKETYHMFVISRELYVYKGGNYFLDDDGIYIKSIIQSIIPEQYITYRTLNAVYSLLIEQSDLQRTMDQINDYPPWWINFQNGMLDVRELRMKKHDPKYLAINQIPHMLDQSVKNNLEAAGAETNKFLEEAVPNMDDRKMLWQYIGYSMTRDSSFQKMLIIKGAGGTGKSRLIALIQDIVGRKNYSNISLQDLNQKFYPSLLHGKLLNACADISSDALMSVDNIKKATGEDILIYEKKGKDPQSFMSYAKLIFSANKIPLNLDEKSNAFYRRLLILQMDKVPKQKDMELDEKLKKEIPYSIWMAISALKELYQGGEFCESQNSRNQVDELYRSADTVKAFIDECIEAKDGSRIARKDLYDKYIEYCKSYGRKEHSPNPFYKSLNEKGYEDFRVASGRYFKNISFKDEGFLVDDVQEGQQVFSDKQVTV